MATAVVTVRVPLRRLTTGCIAMKPLLLAGHPALELLNTAMVADGAPVELIGDGRALVAWFVETGVVDGAEAAQLKRRFTAAGLDEIAAEARRIRGWAADWFTRWRATPDARYEPELRRLNERLARVNDVRQVVRHELGLAIAV